MATKERKGTQKGMQKVRTMRVAGHREPFRHHSQRAPSGRKASFLRPLRSFAAILPSGLVSSIIFTAVASPSPAGRHAIVVNTSRKRFEFAHG